MEVTVGGHKGGERRLFAIIFYLPPKACGFSASKAGSAEERISFQDIIPCSNTQSPATLEYTLQYLLEIQLWLSVTQYHFTTTAGQDPAVHKSKTTAHGKLMIANHPLEFHTVWQTPFWRAVLFLSSPSAPFVYPSPRQDSEKGNHQGTPPLLQWAVDVLCSKLDFSGYLTSSIASTSFQREEKHLNGTKALLIIFEHKPETQESAD